MFGALEKKNFKRQKEVGRKSTAAPKHSSATVEVPSVNNYTVLPITLTLKERGYF